MRACGGAFVSTAAAAVLGLLPVACTHPDEHTEQRDGSDVKPKRDLPAPQEAAEPAYGAPYVDDAVEAESPGAPMYGSPPVDDDAVPRAIPQPPPKTPKPKTSKPEPAHEPEYGVPDL